jgi:hypothetical protein
LTCSLSFWLYASEDQATGSALLDLLPYFLLVSPFLPPPSLSTLPDEDPKLDSTRFGSPYLPGGEVVVWQRSERGGRSGAVLRKKEDGSWVIGLRGEARVREV